MQRQVLPGALAVGLLLAWVPLALAQSPAADSVARLDQSWARAYAVHDTATALALFAPDLVVVGGNGSLKTSEVELENATRRRYSAIYIRGGPLGWQTVTLHISPALSQ